jgi:hypothetical protein
MAKSVERWQQVKSIFQAALEHDAGSRGAFLDGACAGDASLRSDVESLIASHDAAGSFIQRPVFEAAAHLIVSGDAEKTIGVLRRRTGVDPVVAWLVCVSGPGRGKDYSICRERSFIGRAREMDVCIRSDPRVSRNRHALISYDPKSNTFKLGPGDANGLVYLNGEEVEAPSVVEPYDRIQLGQTELLFVPFCGKRFRW